MTVHVSMVEVVLATLAVWRVTHLLWTEDGPWRVFARLRDATRDRFVGRILACFYCLSVWVAMPAALVVSNTWLEGVLVWLGVAGGALLLQRATERPVPAAPPPAVWRIDDFPDAPGNAHDGPDTKGREERHDDVLLRR
jgi:hypothetical protein